MTSFFAPHSRICGPTDKARRFVVERIYEKVCGAVPFAVWVRAKPVRIHVLAADAQLSSTFFPKAHYKEQRADDGLVWLFAAAWGTSSSSGKGTLGICG